MTLSNETAFVTGASRGIGAALVRELLSVGVRKVYATARNKHSIPDFGDARVVPLQLDVTDESSVKAAVAIADDVDVLINNAGTMGFTDFLNESPEESDADMQTNFYGTLRVIRAFAPQFVARGTGTIVNLVSIVGLSSVPMLGGYSASKAALHSLTQTLRGSLKQSGVKVIGIYPGPIDTELAKDVPLEKASVEHAATNIILGIQNGDAYVFPDPTAKQIEHLWANDGRQLEAAMQVG